MLLHWSLLNNCKRKEAIKDQGKKADKRINKNKGIHITKKNPTTDKPLDNNIPNEPTLEIGVQEVEDSSCSQQTDTRLGDNVNDGENLNNTSIQSTEEDNKSDSKYVDATQLVEFLPKTQIDHAHKAQVTDFLKNG